MTQEPVPSLRSRSSSRAVQAAIIVPNAILVVIVALYFVSRANSEKVQPLVKTDPNTSARIAQLEAKLGRDPGATDSALELARLYDRAGEFPWSYDALKNAEKSGGDEPAWRLRLALAYFELGKNADGLRVLNAAHAACKGARCTTGLKVKLEVLVQFGQQLMARQIDARKDPQAAATLLGELLKPARPVERAAAGKGSGAGDGGSPRAPSPASQPR